MDALILPQANSQCMQRFLNEVSSRHIHENIILILDGASWHNNTSLRVPENIRLLPLPPYAPELIPFPVQKDIERGCEFLFNAVDERVACRLCHMRLRQSHLAHARRSVAGQRCSYATPLTLGWSLRGIGTAQSVKCGRVRHPRIMQF